MSGIYLELHGNITIVYKSYSLSPVYWYESPNIDGDYTDNGIYYSLLTSSSDEDYQKVKDRMLD